MAIAFVQRWEGYSSTSTGTSDTVTFSPQPSANSLLIAVVSCRQTNSNPITFTASGWTLVHEGTGLSGADAAGAMFFKVATGAETTQVFSWSESREWAISVCEYSGADSSSPLEQKDENATYVQTLQTNGDPINAGSVTPDTANGMAITTFSSPDERNGDETELSIGDSYTIDDYEVAAPSVNPFAAIASKPYTSTAAQSPDWDTSRSSDWNAFAAIACFKDAGAPPASATVGHLVNSGLVNAGLINRGLVG